MVVVLFAYFERLTLKIYSKKGKWQLLIGRLIIHCIEILQPNENTCVDKVKSNNRETSHSHCKLPSFKSSKIMIIRVCH